jgi:hypothetical protein
LHGTGASQAPGRHPHVMQGTSKEVRANQ